MATTAAPSRRSTDDFVAALAHAEQWRELRVTESEMPGVVALREDPHQRR